MILPIFKPPGATPLQALDQLRRDRPQLAREPLVYAGRLDPMAEGLLLVLSGPDRFELPTYLGLDKCYEARLLFGLRSDSLDALGRLGAPAPPPPVSKALAAVQALIGPHHLALPAWSAYKVRGRPLHVWAAAGRIAEIERPIREMVVREVEVLGGTETTSDTLIHDVCDRVSRVTGTFRQDAVTADWRSLPNVPLVVVHVRLTVTSGTYIRALAEAVGITVGSGALLLTLRRTRIGPFFLPSP